MGEMEKEMRSGLEDARAGIKGEVTVPLTIFPARARVTGP